MTLNEFFTAVDTTAKIKPEELGARLKSLTSAFAPAVAFAYTAGYETGTLVHGLNDRLAKVAVLLGRIPA